MRLRVKVVRNPCDLFVLRWSLKTELDWTSDFKVMVLMGGMLFV